MELSNFWLIIYLVVLILLSAFFSASETAMMTANRYKMLHKAKSGNVIAKIVLHLNKDPSKLLGVILLCNNFVNILASALGTILGIRIFGSSGVIIFTILLTIVILLFAEQIPKTIAAYKPEKFSMVSAGIIYLFSKLLSPIIIIISFITEYIIKILGLKNSSKSKDTLSNNELRELILDSSDKNNTQQKEMLLSILDLEEKTLEEKAIPSNKIYSIDILDDWKEIIKKLESPEHSFIPIYEDNIDNIKGILDIRSLTKFWNRFSHNSNEEDSKKNLLQIVIEPKFLHVSTNLVTAMKALSKDSKTPLAMILDEYGIIKGMITIEMLLDEFTSAFKDKKDLGLSKDSKTNSFVANGSSNLRDLNKMFDLDFAITDDGPKTLNGLVLEDLEIIPIAQACLRHGKYQLDIISLNQKNNTIDKIKIIVIENEDSSF